MPLLTPSEKLFILENKCLPKKEVERIAALLKAKFRFSINRSNGNLITTYLEQVVVGEKGSINRGQEYIRRIAKILDNANTELVAAEIEDALAHKGVYEFKIPSNLASKAKELAKMIVDNGFSFKEFADWLEGAKAYKNDAEDIMQNGKIGSLQSLYTQLLGKANESHGEADYEQYLEKTDAGWTVHRKSGLWKDFTHDQEEEAIKMAKAEAAKPDKRTGFDLDGTPIGSGKPANESHGNPFDALADIWSKKSSEWKAELVGPIISNIVGFDVNLDHMADDDLVAFVKDVEQVLAVEEMPEEAAKEAIIDVVKKHLPGIVTEGRMQIKRPYKRGGVELKPAITVAEEATVRNKIVKFLGGQPLARASKASLMEYFNAMNEDAEIGRRPSNSWLYRNTHLVKKIRVGKDTFYKLTRAGLNLFNKINKTVNEASPSQALDEHIQKVLNAWNDAKDAGYEGDSAVEVASRQLGMPMEEVQAILDDNFVGEASHESVLKGILGNLNNLRDEIDATPEGEVKILIPNYSINVQSKYEDGEELQAELDEIENDLGHTLIVNDYDDLIADPHGVMSDEASEGKEPKGTKEIVLDDIADFDSLPSEVKELFLYGDKFTIADWEGGKGVVSGKVGRDHKTYMSATVDSTGDQLVVLDAAGKWGGNNVIWDGKSKPQVTAEPKQTNEAVSEADINPLLKPYYDFIHDELKLGLEDIQIARGGNVITFQTAGDEPQKYEIGVDGEEVYCLYPETGDDIVLTSTQDLNDYIIGSQTNEATAEQQAAVDWFNSLSDEEKDAMIESFEAESGKKLDRKKLSPAFWSYLEQQAVVAIEAAADKRYEIVVMGDDWDLKQQMRREIENFLPDQTTDGDADKGDWGLIVNDEVDRHHFDMVWRDYIDLDGIHIQAFQNDVPVDLKPHAAMIAEAVNFADSFTVEKPTKQQIVTYRALQQYLKKNFYAGKDYAITSSGTLRIKRSIQEKLTPYLKDLDIISPTGDNKK